MTSPLFPGGVAVLTFPAAVRDDPDAYARAAGLPPVGSDEERAEAARRQLDALSQGLPGTLGNAAVARAEHTAGDPRLGMCGRLRTWDWPVPEAAPHHDAATAAPTTSPSYSPGGTP